MARKPKRTYSEIVFEYKEKHNLFELVDILAALQMELDNMPKNMDKGLWHRRELLKDMAKVRAAMEAEGKADKIEIHNHVYEPK